MCCVPAENVVAVVDSSRYYALVPERAPANMMCQNCEDDVTYSDVQCSQ
jgi:hypothetical protein